VNARASLVGRSKNFTWRLFGKPNTAVAFSIVRDQQSICYLVQFLKTEHELLETARFFILRSALGLTFQRDLTAFSLD